MEEYVHGLHDASDEDFRQYTVLLDNHARRGNRIVAFSANPSWDGKTNREILAEKVDRAWHRIAGRDARE
jgi:hypothetical protein